MDRISRDQMLMEIAEVVSNRGTCSRLQVGAVISRDGRPIVTGYNGAPAGLPHCIHDEYIVPRENGVWPNWLIDYWRMLDPGQVSEPPAGTRIYRDNTHLVMFQGSNVPSPGCTNAEHAERNAIAFAARYGLALEGSELHCTHMPCLTCARTIINAGIVRVVYDERYRKTEGVELLRQVGIEVVDLQNYLMVK